MDISNISPIEFEHLCKEILEHNNFIVETTKASGDGGIDLIATRNDVFLSGKYIVQCKRYASSVGEPILRDLYGVITAEKANKGILMTTGTFTSSAKKFAEDKPIELIDGEKLIEIQKNLSISMTNYSNIRASDKVFIPMFIEDILNKKKERYEEINKLLKKNPRNIEYYCKYISILIDSLELPIEDLLLESLGKERKYILYKYEWNDSIKNALLSDLPKEELERVLDVRLKNYHSKDEIIFNKRQCADYIIQASLHLENNKDLKDIILILKAQSHVIKGEWIDSIQCYKKLLNEPSFKKTLSDSYWDNPIRNPNENALKILRNIIEIYYLFDLNEKAEYIKNKYEELILQEKARLNHPWMRNQLLSYFEELEYELCDCIRINKLYFYLNADYSLEGELKYLYDDYN